MMAQVFSDPQSPFEMEHNHETVQAAVANGDMIPFSDGKGGVFYAAPDRALELVLDKYQQITLDEVKARHATQMKNRWGM